MADADSISDEEARRLLVEFLRQVEKVLQDVVENPRPTIPGRHHESMRVAWNDVKGKFTVAIGALSPTDPIAIETLEGELRDRGLTGPQLIFKLNVFRHARENLLDHGTAKDGQEQRKKPRWFARFFRFFSGTLKAADVLLDSLAAVPGVGLAVWPIKEFKEAIDSGADLGEAG
ncbi:hypothetical protein J4G43_030115 [Bradyrhizobium barranii subsp. barranii]|uniref:Uncharacterized protein n=1 Tax=Bradyrhizobium barranii subsp. barranii TaxID=2823807 RepID=A0A939S6C1_9BRAD|nr:hypothetical protein [Bradyrhizobium barranii]UEM08995.1 hypothetical protein J4G43_030115 [Bradyrhizobium barranii subsp. barranii]